MIVSPADTVTEALVIQARDRPRALAYTADGEGITYEALLRDAQRLASRLAERGVARGQRCAVVLPTALDFIRAVYASQLLAAIPVAINPDLPDEAIVRRLRLVRAHLALCGRGTAARLAAASGAPCPVLSMAELAWESSPAAPHQSPDPGDVAFLQLTSGTTGDSRAVAISHRSLIASLVATAARLELRQDDVMATWVPLHHDLGLVRYVFGAMLSGCPSHLIRPSMGNFRPWLALIARVRATITGGPDSAYRLASRTVDPVGLDLASLRFAGNGGEPVRLETIRNFEQRFGLPNTVRPAYGLAEATLTVTSTGPGDALRSDAHGGVSCGRALEGIELRIADANAHAQPPGEAGEILVRGTPIFSGYFDDDDATRQVLRDGWLHTGDVGRVDPDGYLFVAARSRALIKRGGVTIAPREIEDAVNRVAGVASSAAIGIVLSPTSATEDVVVVAELHDADGDFDALAARIVAEVRSALGFAPGRVLLVPIGTVPLTSAGKVQYEKLRRMVATDALADRLFVGS